MKNKISKLQIARFISQVAFLILLPGLFTLSFSQVGNLYSDIIKGDFNLIASLPYLTTMLVTISITIVFGRFFCGWMCAFGTMNDFIYIISSKIFKFKFKVDAKTDRILKMLKYVVLIFILIFVWTLGSKTLNSFSPWNAFAQISNFKNAIFDYSLGFIILALIAAGAMFIERFFCRYLCPLGGIFSLVSRFRLFKINKPNEKCGKCRLCTTKCSMGIELYKVNKVTSGECINCLKCLDVCPRKNTNISVADENLNPALASSIAIAAFAGVYAASTTAANIAIKNNKASIISSSSTTNNNAKGQYKDGTYTGEGVGFKPGMQVSVTVKNNKISNIEIVSTNDTPGYFDQASSVIPSEIIKAQSTDVDAVSGATRSSNGIMSAVEDALKNAKLNSTSNLKNSSSTKTAETEQNTNSSNTATENNTSSNSSSSNGSSSDSSQKAYKDGTYTGVGNGFRPDLNVSVTIKSGKITNIEMLSNNETPRFFDAASQTVPQEIIEAQSTNVDAVSGATMSSNGIMEAVQKALDKAI